MKNIHVIPHELTSAQHQKKLHHREFSDIETMEYSQQP